MKKILLSIILLLFYVNVSYAAYSHYCGSAGGGSFENKPTSNLCVSGYYNSPVEEISGDWRWNCIESFSGGNTGFCVAEKITVTHTLPPQPENAQCGSSVNSCAIGTFSDVNDSATDYRWSCAGLHGGYGQSCTKPKPVTPVNCRAHWEDVPGSCSVACGNGNFNKIYVIDTLPQYGGLSCPYSEGLIMLEGGSTCSRPACIADSPGGSGIGDPVIITSPDSDSDGIVDEDDNCPDDAGTSELNGCPEYTGSCVTTHTNSGFGYGGELKFENDKIKCNYWDGSSSSPHNPNGENYLIFNGFRITSMIDNLVFSPNRGSGIYECLNDNLPSNNGGVPTAVGYCELTYHGNLDYSNLDSDGDTVLDIDDRCLGESGSTLYNGCNFQYSSYSCEQFIGSDYPSSYNSGGLRFESGNMICDLTDSSTDHKENFIYTKQDRTVSEFSDNLDYSPNVGSKVYYCYNLFGTSGAKDLVGSCELRNNLELITTSNSPVPAETDGDGIYGDDDLCPEIYGLPEFRGCETEYTLEGSCSSSDMSFDGEILHCDNDGDGIWSDSDNFWKFGGKKITGEEVYNYKPIQGSGKYDCYEADLFSDDHVGYCELRHNALISCSNSILTLSAGLRAKMYKYDVILPFEINSSDVSKDVMCNQDKTFTPLNFDVFKYTSPNVLGDDFKDFIRLADGSIAKNDDESEGKVNCEIDEDDSDGDECSIKINGTSHTILIDEDRESYIDIYKNGQFDRKERIQAENIALNAHSIRDFTKIEQVENFVQHSFNVMTNLNISKNLFNSNNKTTVKINLNDIDGINRRDLVIYQIISKDVASHLDKINIINSAGAEFFVLDKDPVIGWYFNDTGSGTEIEYEVPGDNEGGTIIISQEPILFNQGEMIIKYREVNCNADEINLFELDYLIDSNVYPAGSGKLFKVCLSNIDSSINMDKLDLGGSTLDLLSFENNGNMSIDFEKFSEKLTLSTDESDIYWSYFISNDNPSIGNYSCIGSFTSDEFGSTFGDCGNNPALRLWIHLGADNIAPTSSLKTGVVTHNLPITIFAVDDIAGSGVKGFNYCVDMDNSCNPMAGEYVTGNFSDLKLTCPDRWGCIKYVRVQSVDNANNLEVVNSIPVKLIDVDSSCQADCTIRPSPGRYALECNNLNSCEYYDFDFNGLFDDGKYVAGICDLYTEGSYARFNTTHDIKCPAGPFRETIYASSLDIKTNCNNVNTVPYQTMIEGELVTLNVIVCSD
mgnify:CR=1 FL=1